MEQPATTTIPSRNTPPAHNAYKLLWKFGFSEQDGIVALCQEELNRGNSSSVSHVLSLLEIATNEARQLGRESDIHDTVLSCEPRSIDDFTRIISELLATLHGDNPILKGETGAIDADSGELAGSFSYQVLLQKDAERFSSKMKRMGREATEILDITRSTASTKPINEQRLIFLNHRASSILTSAEEYMTEIAAHVKGYIDNKVKSISATIAVLELQRHGNEDTASITIRQLTTDLENIKRTSIDNVISAYDFYELLTAIRHNVAEIKSIVGNATDASGKRNEEVATDSETNTTALTGKLYTDKGNLNSTICGRLNGAIVAATNETLGDLKLKEGDKGTKLNTVSISVTGPEAEPLPKLLRIVFMPTYHQWQNTGAHPYAILCEITFPELGINDPLVLLIRQSAMSGNEVQVLSKTFPLHCELGSEVPSYPVLVKMMKDIVAEIADASDVETPTFRYEEMSQTWDGNAPEIDTATIKDGSTTITPKGKKTDINPEDEIEVISRGLTERMCDPELWINIAIAATQGRSTNEELFAYVEIDKRRTVSDISAARDHISIPDGLFSTSEKGSKSPVDPKKDMTPPPQKYIPTVPRKDKYTIPIHIGELQSIVVGDQLTVTVNVDGIANNNKKEVAAPTEAPIPGKLFECTGSFDKGKIVIHWPKSLPRFRDDSSNVSSVSSVWIKGVAMMKAAFEACQWKVEVEGMDDEVPATAEKHQIKVMENGQLVDKTVLVPLEKWSIPSTEHGFTKKSAETSQPIAKIILPQIEATKEDAQEDAPACAGDEFALPISMLFDLEAGRASDALNHYLRRPASPTIKVPPPPKVNSQGSCLDEMRATVNVETGAITNISSMREDTITAGREILRQRSIFVVDQDVVRVEKLDPLHPSARLFVGFGREIKDEPKKETTI